MFVSDGIGNSYEDWKPGDLVVIHAQTGSGKTYFVLNVLLPYVNGEGKKLLYLSNRTALTQQVRALIDPEFEESIITENYQSFERVRLSYREYEKPSPLAQSFLDCDYWIMDEAHYFLTDANFNSDMLSALNHIKSHYKTRVLIFMTATLEYLLLALGQCGLFTKRTPYFTFADNLHSLYACRGYLSHTPLLCQLASQKSLLAQKEMTNVEYELYQKLLNAQKNYKLEPDQPENQFNLWVAEQKAPRIDPEKFQSKHQEYLSYFDSVKKEPFLYQAGHEYTFVSPVYFRTIEQLCKRIQQTCSAEKWLIFVSSKNNGEYIRTCLENIGLDCVFITADTKKRKFTSLTNQSKEYQAYQHIIDHEKSPERITISTSVLDNGINLKDPQLKHVAILEMNPTLFLQMLGRKRLSHQSENFNIYLQVKDIGEIKAFFNRNILYLVRFLVELQYVNNYEDNIIPRKEDYIGHDNLHTFARAYQVNGNFRPPFCHFVQKRNKLPKLKEGFPNYTCRLFEPNPYTSVRLAYDYYRMLALLEQYENLSEEEKRIKKESLWIEHQLSWLGLQYDPTCWIDYEQHIKAKKIISTILARRSGNVLSCTVQGWLKRAVQQAVLTSHPPLKVKIGAASLKKVNEALIELGYDKQIKSKNRSINGVQRNYWTVVPAGDDQ